MNLENKVFCADSSKFLKKIPKNHVPKLNSFGEIMFRNSIVSGKSCSETQ